MGFAFGVLSFAAEDGSEAEGEVDAYAAHLDLAKPYAAGGDLDVGGYQQGEAIADACLGAHRQIQRGEKIVGVTGIGNSFCLGSVIKVIIVITGFVGEQIGGGADACKKEGAAGGAEIIPEIKGYLEHAESSFDIVNGGSSCRLVAHPHSMSLIVTVGNVVVLRGRCKDLCGE